MATLTTGQKRVLRIIASRSEIAWPRDLEERYKFYHGSLRSLIRKGLVIKRNRPCGTVYILAR
jgi:hypothetical protein